MEQASNGAISVLTSEVSHKVYVRVSSFHPLDLDYVIIWLACELPQICGFRPNPFDLIVSDSIQLFQTLFNCC